MKSFPYVINGRLCKKTDFLTIFDRVHYVIEFLNFST